MKVYVVLFFLSFMSIFSQNVQFFDINTDNYPILTAKVEVFDANFDRVNNLQGNLSLTENGDPVSVSVTNCPPESPLNDISSVLTVDISGSMNSGLPQRMFLAKEATKVWVEALPNNSEAAITSFNHLNYLNIDFTQDKSLLNTNIDNLFPYDGTDYNPAFLNQFTGALNIARNGQNKRIIVFLTDGLPNSVTQAGQIIAEALASDIEIYCVTLGMPCPTELRTIAEQTGGSWFENVTDLNQAKGVYRSILNRVQGIEACEIEWTSNNRCEVFRNVELTYIPLNISDQSTYQVSQDDVSFLEFDQFFLQFGGVEPLTQSELTLNVTARNGDITVSDIEFNLPLFDANPRSFSLLEDESINIRFTFNPADSGVVYSTANFINDACDKRFSLMGGFSRNYLKYSKFKNIRYHFS